jgi:hypothetical protein
VNSSTPLITWISLGIAILGFVLAAISLVVHIYQYKNGGGRIEVTLEPHSQLVGVTDKPGGEATAYVREKGLLVTARNTGRLEAYVTDFGLALPDTVAKLRPNAQRLGAAAPKPEQFRIGDQADTFRCLMVGLDYTLPQRVAPGETKSWWLPLKESKEVTVNAGIGLPVVRGVVLSGAGRRVFSKTSVDLGTPESSFDALERGIQPARLINKPSRPAQIDKVIKLHLADPPSTAAEGDGMAPGVVEEQEPPIRPHSSFS